MTYYFSINTFSNIKITYCLHIPRTDGVRTNRPPRSVKIAFLYGTYVSLCVNIFSWYSYLEHNLKANALGKNLFVIFSKKTGTTTHK